MIFNHYLISYNQLEARRWFSNLEGRSHTHSHHRDIFNKSAHIRLYYMIYHFLLFNGSQIIFLIISKARIGYRSHSLDSQNSCCWNKSSTSFLEVPLDVMIILSGSRNMELASYHYILICRCRIFKKWLVLFLIKKVSCWIMQFLWLLSLIFPSGENNDTRATLNWLELNLILDQKHNNRYMHRKFEYHA